MAESSNLPLETQSLVENTPNEEIVFETQQTIANSHPNSQTMGNQFQVFSDGVEEFNLESKNTQVETSNAWVGSRKNEKEDKHNGFIKVV